MNEERYCLDPSCKLYLNMQECRWDQGVTSGPPEDCYPPEWIDEPECKECGGYLFGSDAEPDEVLAEYYLDILNKEINNKQWKSKAFLLYKDILKVIEERGDL